MNFVINESFILGASRAAHHNSICISFTSNWLAVAKPLADFTKSLPHLPSYPAEIFSWAKLSYFLSFGDCERRRADSSEDVQCSFGE